MNPGLLNKKITFLQLVTTENTFGEDVGSYEDLFTTSAKIKPLQGREFFQAQQIHSEITTKITIRFRKNYPAPILPEMKIRHGERTLEIISSPINVNEQNRYLEILCKEVF
jgi:SPP1 family predicted phage head-tail adaptor